MIKYIKSVLWRVAKCLSYIEEARCLKVKQPQDTSNAVGVITTTSLQKCTSVPGLCGNAYIRRSFQESTKFAAGRTRAETKEVYPAAKALSTNW